MQNGKRKRLVPKRGPGLIDKSAPYWKGERAESIVSARAIENSERKRSRRAGGSGQPRKPRSPHAELRRLERALARRKTLAAQQRIQAQIKQMKKELGL